MSLPVQIANRRQSQPIAPFLTSPHTGNNKTPQGEYRHIRNPPERTYAKRQNCDEKKGSETNKAAKTRGFTSNNT
jgi:hypothetical protein